MTAKKRFIEYWKMSAALSRVSSRSVRRVSSRSATHERLSEPTTPCTSRASSSARDDLVPSPAAGAAIVRTLVSRHVATRDSTRADDASSAVGSRRSTQITSMKWSAGLKPIGTGYPAAAKCAAAASPAVPK